MRAVAAAQEQPSLISRFFGLFKSKSPETPVAQVDTAKPRNNNAPRRDREGNRPEGGRPEGNRAEGNKQDGNRQRNKPRRDRDDTPRTEKPARPEAVPKTQEPRAERPPRPPRVAIEKPALEIIPQTDAANAGPTDENGNRAGRKRGRRGGQRERERREQQAAELNPLEQPGNAVNEALTAVVQDVTAEQRPSQVVEQLQTPAAAVAIEPVAMIATPVAAVTAPEVVSAPQVIAAPVIVSAPEPVAISVPVAVVPAPVSVPEPAPAPAVAAQNPAPIQESLPLSNSGLVQIETAPSKVAAITSAQAEVSQQPVTRRRPRPREVYSMESSEPLVQIETQNKPN
jgi:ribonuclease E